MRAVREFALRVFEGKGCFPTKARQNHPFHSSFIAGSLREVEDIVRISTDRHLRFPAACSCRSEVRLITDHCTGRTVARDSHPRQALVRRIGQNSEDWL